MLSTWISNSLHNRDNDWQNFYHDDSENEVRALAFLLWWFSAPRVWSVKTGPFVVVGLYYELKTTYPLYKLKLKEDCGDMWAVVLPGEGIFGAYPDYETAVETAQSLNKVM